ncbi:MAG: hypothetical protein ACLFSU_05930, partial [Acholeplasmataceae bacterium]
MKNLLVTGLILVLLLVCGPEVQAHEEETRKNVLDLSNLVVRDGMAHTKEGIDVDANENYTLVMSRGFLGEHYASLATKALLIEGESSSVERTFRKDGVEQRGYVEFEAPGDRIHLTGIPLDPQECYRVMLFKGDYADYAEFEPFFSGTLEVHSERTIEIPYETELSVADIEDQVRAYGPGRQPIEHTMIEDEYSSGNRMPGTYALRFEAVHRDVIGTFHLFVNVVDTRPPEISGETEYYYEITERPTVAEIKELMVVADNVDELGPEDLRVVTDT